MPVTIVGDNTPTAGGVVYGDGTNYASTAAGTSGQVLISGGSGAPTWATQGALGSWVYLSTVTVSGAATADIESTFDSTYDMYAIVAVNVSVATSGAIITARMKIGGSYITTSTYRYLGNEADDSSTTTVFFASGGNQNTLRVTTNLTNTANYVSAFVAYVPNPSGSTIKTMFVNGVATEQTPAVSLINTAGYNTGTGALTGVRFYASSGNLSGTFRLYGIKNS